MKTTNNPMNGYGSSWLENVQLIELQEVDSTNNYLRQLNDEECGSEIIVATTQRQTSGRGQRGNSWESEPEKNLIFSIKIHPSFLLAKEQFILSQAISLSIKEVLDDYIRNVRIKWPNDIYWHKKKICGILIENDLIGKNLETSVIGVGLNLNQEAFSSDAPNPVSLWQITGQEYEPLVILRKILLRFTYYYKKIRKGNTQDLIDLYHKGLFHRTGYHMFRQGDLEFEARIRRIDPDGYLVLQDTDGITYTFGFKEVEYVL